MKTITYLELKNLIDKKDDFILLDIREKHELDNGMIPTAKSFPLSEFDNITKLSFSDFKKKYGFSLTKELPVVVYCRTGGRSSRAADFLANKGFQVINFPGSVQEWSKHDKNVKMY